MMQIHDATNALKQVHAEQPSVSMAERFKRAQATLDQEATQRKEEKEQAQARIAQYHEMERHRRMRRLIQRGTLLESMHPYLVLLDETQLRQFLLVVTRTPAAQQMLEAWATDNMES